MRTIKTRASKKEAVVSVPEKESPLVGMQLQFGDKTVTMDTFVRVLAAMVGEVLRKPDTMSLNKARKAYGNAAVNRWIREGMIIPLRTGATKTSTLVVRTKDLDLCQAQDQLGIK